jgi:hypothetical protein
VATVTNIKIRNAVSGYARTAASARLLAAARPWMTEAGVCPASAHPRHGAGGALPRIEGIGRQVLFLEPSGTSLSAHPSDRRFDTYDPGFPDLRPPV